jgi:hypothetical protein
MCLYDIVPQHIYQYITVNNNGVNGHHGEWPGQSALPSEVATSQPLNPNPFTYAQLTGPGGEQYTWVGTNVWRYHANSYVSGVGGGLTLDAFPNFWMNRVSGETDWNYYWQAGAPRQVGAYYVRLSDLVMLANAYGTTGTGAVPWIIGGVHVWEPGCDLAAPTGVVGLTDLVALAVHYGQAWGDYTALTCPP